MSSLTYQHAPQNALFDIGTRINILSNKLCDLKKQVDNLTNNLVVVDAKNKVSSAYNNGVIQLLDDKGENQGIVVKSHNANLNDVQHDLLEINKTTQKLTLGFPRDSLSDPRASIDVVRDLNVNTTTGINLFQSPNQYKLNADGDGLWFKNTNKTPQSKSLLGFGLQIKYPSPANNFIVIERGEDTVHNHANSNKISFSTEITSAGAIVIHK
jgi:GTP cyclohydrolase II